MLEALLLDLQQEPVTSPHRAVEAELGYSFVFDFVISWKINRFAKGETMLCELCKGPMKGRDGRDTSRFCVFAVVSSGAKGKGSIRGIPLRMPEFEYWFLRKSTRNFFLSPPEKKTFPRNHRALTNIFSIQK